MIEGFASLDQVKPIKIWLQKLVGFGKLEIPEDYPASSSVFSLDFSDEDAAVIQTMESNLGTDDSIITEEMIPENTILSNYVGTFDVQGEAGEETLLSPIRMDNAADVIAMHYNEESEAWEQIEDAHLVNGYAYGTLESFSPIAVFALTRDSFLDTSNTVVKRPLFVANGLPVVITTKDNKVVAKDSNGKETEIPSNAYVIGGTIDGSDLDSISVTVKDATVSKVFVGSFNKNLDKPATVKKAVINLDNAILGGLTGSYYAVRADEVVVNAKDSTVSWIGASESIWQDAPAGVQKDSGSMDVMNLAAKSYVKKFTINFDHSKCPLMFLAGNCGYTYTVEGNGNITNGSDIGYLISGGSNGGTDKSSMKVSDSKINIFQTNNRGFIKSVPSVEFKNCVINMLFIAGDATDSTVTGHTGYVDKIEVLQKSKIVKLCAGTQDGNQITSYDELKSIVGKVVLGRDVEYTFGEKDGVNIFGDIIRIK